MGIIFGPTYMAKDPCFFCGRTADTWDHIVPKSDGGEIEDNLTRACGSCNRKKKEFNFVDLSG